MMGDGSQPEEEYAPPGIPSDDLGKRRDRTYAYLKLWGLETDLTMLPIVRAPLTTRTSADVCGRAGATALVGLKGQGLSQLEVFAFADAYELWDALTVEENDFVLDAEPTPEKVVQYAWRFEQTFVYEWALGLVAHLRLPDAPVNNGRATELLMTRVLTVPAAERPEVRTPKELADSADIAFALQAIASAPSLVGEPAPAAMMRSVVEERAAAFRWLLAY